jgi:hypothetical protein
MIGADRIAGLPTEGEFDTIQDHVDLLSGKVRAAPTRATATDAAEIVRDMCLIALRRRLPGRAGGGP